MLEGEEVCIDEKSREQISRSKESYFLSLCLTICDWKWVCGANEGPSLYQVWDWQQLFLSFVAISSRDFHESCDAELFDISGSEDAIGTAEMYAKAMNQIVARMWKMVLDMFSGLFSAQTSPWHITHFMFNKFKKLSLLYGDKQFLLLQWSAKGQSRLHIISNEVLVSVDCAALGYWFKSETFCTRTQDLVCSLQYRERRIVWLSTTTIANVWASDANITLWLAVSERCDGVTPEMFQRWAIKLPVVPTDREEKDCSFRVMPELFWAIWSVNDERYHLQDGLQKRINCYRSGCLS